MRGVATVPDQRMSYQLEMVWVSDTFVAANYACLFPTSVVLCPLLKTDHSGVFIKVLVFFSNLASRFISTFFCISFEEANAFL